MGSSCHHTDPVDMLGFGLTRAQWLRDECRYRATATIQSQTLPWKVA